MCNTQVEDPRLDCAILRPMESDGDHFLAYYLTKDDETAEEFKQARQIGAPADEVYRFTQIFSLRFDAVVHAADTISLRPRLRNSQSGAGSAERIFAGHRRWR